MSGDPSVFQDSFESIVKENMEDFGMEQEEAVSDAIQQLKTQGVDTRFIVTDQRAGDVPALIDELAALAAATPASAEQRQRLAELLEQLRQFCAAGLSQRCLAGRRGAYPAVLACLEADETAAAALRALAALQDGQPDLFRPADCALLLDQLRRRPDDALPWATAVTLKHEANRQALAEAGLLAELAQLLRRPAAEGGRLPAVCALIRHMTLDDDVRVAYGQAHEHARQLVAEHGVLEQLLALLKDSAEEPALAAELIYTCTKLCVRKEFCEQFADGGSIEAMLEAMRRNFSHTALVGRTFFLMRTLAGSDQVKAAIMNSGAADIIRTALDALKAKPLVCEAAFSAIGALTLRSGENAQALAAAGLLPVIAAAMEQHRSQPKTLKLACMAIRNLASRSPELRPAFRELGVEQLINDALRAHGQQVDAEARAALRDLGCQVALKEEWTGRGGALTTGRIMEPERPDA